MAQRGTKSFICVNAFCFQPQTQTSSVSPNRKCWRHLASCPLRPVKYLQHCPQISIKSLSPLLMRCPAISAISAIWGQRQSKGRQLLTLRVDFILITQVHDSPQGHWENMQPHNCQDSQPWPQRHIQVDDRTWNIQFSKSKKILMLHFI